MLVIIKHSKLTAGHKRLGSHIIITVHTIYSCTAMSCYAGRTYVYFVGDLKSISKLAFVQVQSIFIHVLFVFMKYF